jgi:hypothetical protein
VKRAIPSGYEGISPLKHTPVTSRDRDHQRIERDLQRQQVMIKSRSQQDREIVRTPAQKQTPAQPETKTVIHRGVPKAPMPPSEQVTSPPAQNERTIIRVRKKETRQEDQGAYEESGVQSGPAHQEELELAVETEDFSQVPLPEEMQFGIKTRSQQARDDIFLGKSVSHKEPSRVKDAALLHTDINTKKGRSGQERDDPVSSPASGKKKTGKSSAQDDKISWVND